MPTPAPPRTPVTAHPSRQQLDELDALLQRMLALPVNRLEDELFTASETPAPGRSTTSATVPSASGRPTWSSPPSAVPDPLASTGTGPSPTGTSGTAAQESGRERATPVLGAADEEEHFSRTRPSRPGSGGVLFIPTGPAQPTLDPPQANEPAQPGDVPASVESGSSATLDNDTPPPVWWLSSLWWADGCFDRATASLGVTGRWLRSGGGRTALGGIGLLLWALALAVVLAAWIGWTGSP
jgi:hypothetical protein